MKYQLTIGLIFSLALLDAKGISWRTIRRTTLATACAMSIADAVTTKGRELNPMLSNSNGTPNMARIYLIKSATCIGLTMLEEKTPNSLNKKLWIPMNIGVTGIGGYTTWKNLQR